MSEEAIDLNKGFYRDKLSGELVYLSEIDEGYKKTYQDPSKEDVLSILPGDVPVEHFRHHYRLVEDPIVEMERIESEKFWMEDMLREQIGMPKRIKLGTPGSEAGREFLRDKYGLRPKSEGPDAHGGR